MPEPVALVLAGGGARGAYEAGALSVLLPELERRGQRPSIVVGTSVGALNAAFAAANAHRSVPDVVADARRIWGDVAYGDVLAPLLSPGTVARAAAYLAEALGVPRARLWSLLDPAPLRATLAERIDFGALRRNAGAGRVRAAVVATAARTNRSVVFCAGGAPARRHDPRRGIDYVPARLDVEHVLASAAIPALFPSVRVERPRAAAGWYLDGGTRLNTPVKPALELGAARVVVVAMSSPAPAEAGDERPDALAAAGQLLGGLLDDQLAGDVRTLATVNELVRAAGGEVPDPEGGRAKRVVPHIVVAPERPEVIGAIARATFAEHYAGVGGTLHHPDLSALGHAVAGGTDAAHGELLSYLLFAPEFTRALLDLGAEDARRWLTATHPDDIWDV